MIHDIEECKFGIHDISRTELNDNGLPRFNMPLELGIFLGAMQFGTSSQRGKVCKVLDSERYRYREFLSDIAGQDPSAHNGDVEQAIVIVRDWLQANQPRETLIPSGTKIVKRYRHFQDELPVICEPLLDHNTLTFWTSARSSTSGSGRMSFRRAHDLHPEGPVVVTSSSTRGAHGRDPERAVLV